MTSASSTRIPGLDGLRAVSIALVLVGHSLGFARHAEIGDLANLGVRVFFVISGLLITSLLLREHEARDSISLPKFYARRALRIMPPLFAFLAVVFAVEQIGWLPASSGTSWAHALTYTINYVPVSHRPWHLGHLWSLAVEEQFYLLWPLALVLLGRARSLRGAALVLVLVPLIRYLTWRYLPGSREGIKWEFQTVCDALATGCVLAGIRDRLWAAPRYRRWLQSRWPLLLIPVIAFGNWYIVGRPRGGYLFGISAVNIAIALFIEYCIRSAGTGAARLLEWRLIVLVGTLSYSIYLWQQLFFETGHESMFQMFPLNLAATFALAASSYFLLERPLLAWRRRLARV